MFFIYTPCVLVDFEANVFECQSLQYIKREGFVLEERSQDMEPVRSGSESWKCHSNSCVTLGKLFNFSEPQFPHVENEDNNT